jgi:hypothetical protein
MVMASLYDPWYLPVPYVTFARTRSSSVPTDSSSLRTAPIRDLIRRMSSVVSDRTAPSVAVSFWATSTRRSRQNGRSFLDAVYSSTTLWPISDPDGAAVRVTSRNSGDAFSRYAGRFRSRFPGSYSDVFPVTTALISPLVSIFC